MVLSTIFWFKVDYSFPIMFCRDRMVVGFTTTCAICTYPRADPGFQVRGAYLNKMFGVFRVKNHDFTPKNHIFSDFKGARALYILFTRRAIQVQPSSCPCQDNLCWY